MPQRHQSSSTAKKLSTSKIILEWSAPEYVQHEKSRRWYAIALAIGILLIILAIINDNLTMAMAIVVFAGVYYYMQINHKPGVIKVRIGDMGIFVGNMYFPFSRVTAFWFVDGPGVHTLNLRISGRYHSDVIIQLGHQNPGIVRDVLIGRIPEWEGKNEPFFDIILRLLKF